MTIYRGIYPSHLPVLGSPASDDIVIVRSGDTFYQTSIAAFRAVMDREARAIQEQFEDITNTINTQYKYPGRPRYDITTGKWLFARGGEPSDPWLDLLSNTVVYTPV